MIVDAVFNVLCVILVVFVSLFDLYRFVRPLMHLRFFSVPFRALRNMVTIMDTMRYKARTETQNFHIREQGHVKPVSCPNFNVS